MTQDIKTITQPTLDLLSEREETDYREFKEALNRWLDRLGKDPQYNKGYAKETVRQTSSRIDRFYRWIWATEGYTTTATEDDADGYMKHLVMHDKEYSNNYLANEQKAIKRLFKWMNHERGKSIEWASSLSFSSSQTMNHRDFLTIEERKGIREAALQYGSVPAYNGLSSDERDEWRAHLAQRFDKPKYEVSKDDWDRANGWKIPSLVWTSLDTGLRPVEVERATTEWGMSTTESSVSRKRTPVKTPITGSCR